MSRFPCLSLLVACALAGAAFAAPAAPPPLPPLSVTILDVGQGQATLVQIPPSVDLPYGFDLLVDAGPDATGGALAGKVRSLYAASGYLHNPINFDGDLDPKTDLDIDLLISTRPTPERIGGMDRLLWAFQVPRVWLSPAEFGLYKTLPVQSARSDKEQREFYIHLMDEWYFPKRAADPVPIVVEMVTAGRQLVVGGARITVLAAPSQLTPLTSLLIHIAYGADSLLLLGDTKPAEARQQVGERWPAFNAVQLATPATVSPVAVPTPRAAAKPCPLAILSGAGPDKQVEVRLFNTATHGSTTLTSRGRGWAVTPSKYPAVPVKGRPIEVR
jgi:beta-lactamase superfamily II metal-dependent hydrolase